jgi:sec-independent protein translocase protein TatC
VACSAVLASPWIFWQGWSFVGAGLYPREKRPVLFYLPLSVLLLAAGILICQVWVIPKAVETLLGFNEWLDLEPDLRLKEWLGFAVWMPLAFGLSFQTPLLMLVLERVGLLSIETYRNKRRLAWFLMAIIAGIVTPPFDVMSMLVLWVVLGILYEIGILLCMRLPRHAGTIEEDVYAPKTREG